MKCIFYETWFGSCVCFFGNEYPTKGICEIKEQVNEYSVIIIVVSSVSEYQDAMELIDIIHQGKSIIVNIDGCSSENIISSFLQQKQKGRIKQLVVSTIDMYKVLQYNDVIIGYEQWMVNDYPSSLKELDATVKYISCLRTLLPEINEIIDTIESAQPESDLERIILIDGWIQKHIQYVKERDTVSNDGIHYICEQMGNEGQEANSEDPILHHFGRCEDIAFSVAAILNHPRIGIKCRMVGWSDFNINFNHSWNIVMCNGKEYYLDCTHNITRNPDRHPTAFKSQSYSTQFTLLGTDDAAEKYSVPECFDSSKLSKASFDRNELKSAITGLVERGVFATAWNTPPALVSYIQ